MRVPGAGRSGGPGGPSDWLDEKRALVGVKDNGRTGAIGGGKWGRGSGAGGKVSFEQRTRRIVEDVERGAGSRVDLEQVRRVAGDEEVERHQPDEPERGAKLRGGGAHPILDAGGKLDRADGAAVAIGSGAAADGHWRVMPITCMPAASREGEHRMRLAVEALLIVAPHAARGVRCRQDVRFRRCRRCALISTRPDPRAGRCAFQDARWRALSIAR